jgi:hypothetical protein
MALMPVVGPPATMSCGNGCGCGTASRTAPVRWWRCWRWDRSSVTTTCVQRSPPGFTRRLRRRGGALLADRGGAARSTPDRCRCARPLRSAAAQSRRLRHAAFWTLRGDSMMGELQDQAIRQHCKSSVPNVLARLCLKIKPAPHHRIEVGDDPFQAAPHHLPGFRSDGVLELRQALRARPSLARLEVTPKKVKSIRPRVHQPRLGRMQGQTGLRRPVPHQRQGPSAPSGDRHSTKSESPRGISPLASG